MFSYLRRSAASIRPAGPSDDNTDFYTVPLTQETLRPGTVYADPYGHVLMLVQRVPQTAARPASFLAVDGEPDGTVARKRFWRGNFLFAHEPALGSPGFKRFRPIVREASGALRRLTNDEIAKDPQYGDFSLEQSQLSVEDFYDRMDDVMSPQPLDPLRAMKDGDRFARRASQDARRRRSRTAASSRTGTAATPTCRTARRSSRPPARGRISRRRRAICGC